MLWKNTGAVGAVAALLASGLGAQAQSPAAPPAPALPQAEVSDVAVLPAATARWVYLLGEGGTRIFDGDTGKMKGMIQNDTYGNTALDPRKRYYLTAESIWTKVTRGARQDMVVLWDAANLKVQSEIALPGRLLGGTNLNNFVVSTDGKLAFVYNMQPSSSVEVVDIEKRKHQQTVQLPGCAALFPSGPAGVAALCADGSLTTIGFPGGKAKLSKTAPFFSAANDPIFDAVVVDRAKNLAVFLTYTGKIYTATLGDEPKVSEPWSIQSAAGVRDAVAAPLNVDWLPGGRQPLALNRVTGRLYVLMHVGEQWSQKQAATEIWVVDLATRKVVKRLASPGKATSIQVSQETEPQIYASGEGKMWVLDGEATAKHTVEQVGGNLLVVEPS